jgi:Cu(I)/Ag(I) efflux system membrane fusion protein
MAPWMKDQKNIVITLLALTCLFLLYLVSMGSGSSPTNEDHAHATTEEEATVWTCSMHPQIQLPQPGQCPICGMDLIPASQGGDEGGPWELSLSPHAKKLAGIETTPVQKRSIAHEIRMVGKVDYDEKRVGDITAWVSGRVDRLFVDFTGIEVRKGDHMVEMYSPDLITAQQELRQALNSAKTGPNSIKKASNRRLNAARSKLALLGLSKLQIKAIENRDGPTDHLTIEAPMAGIVIKKHLNEGAYVQTGSPIYTVADLSRVWVILDAYESDLAWLRYGQEVEFEVEAYPGETFTGRIVFIDPTLNPKTRTIKVRIDMPNTNARLKPEMFVRAVSQAMISPGGKVIDPSLAGKWICPMHPEVIKDDADSCGVCGMDLVQAEDLGFATTEAKEAPLVIPASAALVTGERAVVYVATDEENSVFQGREVILGPEAGDFIIVKSGLEEGEKVVTNGAFKIDSELQIRAKYSMMYHPSLPDAGAELVILDPHTPFKESLKGVYDAYFRLQTQLSQDALHLAHKAGSDLERALESVAIEHIGGQARILWNRETGALIQHLSEMGKAAEIDEARAAFEGISDSLYRIAVQFGFPEPANIYLFHCPMAFDNRGAHWLQNHTDTSNPYFGSMMFSCGSQVRDVIQERINAMGSTPGKGGGHEH